MDHTCHGNFENKGGIPHKIVIQVLSIRYIGL